MKPKSLLYFVSSTFVLFLLSSYIAGQAVQRTIHTPAWTRAASFGGSGTDSGAAVKVDTRGNRYVTGGFSLTARFGNKTLASAGGTDIFLAKFGSSGELQWLLQAGGPGDDVGHDIAFDREQNIYLSGSFTDSATFHSVNGPAKKVTGAGLTIFLAKYAPSGKLAWVQTGIASFNGQDEAFGVAIDPATGTVFITGITQGDTTFSSSDGAEHTVPGVFTWHMFLVKYDTDGNFHWGQTNQASPNTIPHKVAVDAHDNAYVTGWLESTTTFHSNSGHDLTVTGLSQPVQSFPDFPDDAFIVKYDAEGNAKWVNLIGGYKGIATDIAVSEHGEISITGFIGNIAGTPLQAKTIATSQPGGKNINLGGGHLTNPFNKDAFVTTYNSAGVLLKARRIGGNENDGGSGVSYDHQGNLYVAGGFQGRINVEGQSLTGEKRFNLFVLKFKPGTGDLEWAKKADGAGQDNLEVNQGMCVTPAREVLVTGGYQNTADFDAIRLHSAGDLDIFLAELNAIPDKDKCESSRCGDKDDDKDDRDKDDDNRKNQGAKDIHSTETYTTAGR
ncbi:MAG TPA: SBBP repeat-containing protein [Candidatus Angelobacter sp.]|nr:SBBP repeat-containing protein [Candidatus Angelobacter sp.]